MRHKVLREPWRTFFEALDQELSAPCVWVEMIREVTGQAPTS